MPYFQVDLLYWTFAEMEVRRSLDWVTSGTTWFARRVCLCFSTFFSSRFYAWVSVSFGRAKLASSLDHWRWSCCRRNCPPTSDNLPLSISHCLSACLTVEIVHGMRSTITLYDGLFPSPVIISSPSRPPFRSAAQFPHTCRTAWFIIPRPACSSR